jgi:hypothetical protein
MAFGKPGRTAQVVRFAYFGEQQEIVRKITALCGQIVYYLNRFFAKIQSLTSVLVLGAFMKMKGFSERSKNRPTLRNLSTIKSSSGVK